MIFSVLRRQGLIEASYEADAAARAEALKVWKGIESYAQNERAAYTTTRLHTGEPGLLLSAGTAGLPKDLDVKLSASRKSSCIYDPGGRPPYTIELGRVLSDPKSLRVSEFGLSDAKEHFVHEFIHYLDYGRRKDSGKGSDVRQATRAGLAIRAGQTSDFQQYMQNPMEFNAWFQIIASTVESFVDSALRGIARGGRAGMAMRPRLVQIFSSLERFRAHVLRNGDDAEAVKLLKGSKWERKWDKRVSQLYTGLKAKVDAALGKTEGVMLFSADRRNALVEAAGAISLATVKAALNKEFFRLDSQNQGRMMRMVNVSSGVSIKEFAKTKVVKKTGRLEPTSERFYRASAYRGDDPKGRWNMSPELASLKDAIAWANEHAAEAAEKYRADGG